MATEVVLEHALNFEFLHACSHSLHRFDVRFRGDVCSALHELDLFVALDAAHLVNDGRRIDYRARRMNGFAIERAHGGYLANDLVIQLSINSQSIVKRAGTIQDVLELCIELRNWKCSSGAKVRLSAVDPGALAVPDFSF